MRPVSCRTLCALLLLGLLVHLPAGATTPSAPIHAVIGNPTVQLTGPWRFHPGDNLAWADRGYDDSAWPVMDLTPPAGSIDPVTGVGGYIPGWTAQGYPHLTGYAWYRLRVEVSSGSGNVAPPLAIRMPDDVDDAYQVYVDGQLIGQFGRFRPTGVTSINAQPRAFPLPSNLPGGPITIAIRMWMDRSTPFQSPDSGGLHATPLLGQAAFIHTMLQISWDEIDRFIASYLLRILLLGTVALLGFVLFGFDRREKPYLWLALVCTVYVLDLLLTLAGYYVTWLPMTIETLITDVILAPILFGLWAIFWAHWFGLPEMRRLHAAAWSLVALLVVGVAMLRPPLYGSLIPVTASAWLLPLTEILKLAFGAVVFWIAYRGIRTRGVEGWLALIPILLMPAWLYQDELVTLHLYPSVMVHGTPVAANTIAIVLMLMAISALILRRYVGNAREKQRIETELEQARQVQQVLLPEAHPSIPGFEIQSEYHPARQVGGDFFQIVALENGSFLVVIGDVSGKGVPAAMTVSLLVGAIRTALSTTTSPAALLDVLNTRMIGRSRGGFTTCLAARVDPDGTVIAATAGHLPPYLNGIEVAVENGLPLGLSAGADYGETIFHLPPGGRLTLLTDGVVEARLPTGELFGFERTAGISQQPAASIAETAQRFGQEDDITVLSIVRLSHQPAASAETAAHSPAPA